MGFENIFQKIGRFNYHNRFLVLASTFTITLIFALGLVNIRLQSDPQSLWVSKDSIGYIQQQDFDNRFGAFFRTQQIIMRQVSYFQIINFLTGQLTIDQYFQKRLFVFYVFSPKSNQQKIYRIQQLIDKDIRSVLQTYQRQRLLQTKQLFFTNKFIGPLDLWKMDLSDLQKDPEIQYTAMCIQSRSQKSRIPCSDQSQIPIIKQSIFGGISCDSQKDKNSTIIIPCDHCWLQAKTLSATYLLNNDKYTQQAASIWQKDVLIDSIHKFNADNGSFVQQLRNYFNISSDGMIQIEKGEPINITKLMPSFLNIHFQYLSERSISDQLQNQTSQNMWIVVISYLAMFLYIGVAIGQFPSKISSGFTLSIVGIIIVLASVLSSMGLISYMGIGFTMISGEVIPFLILAIGVDNMFIIKNAIQKQTQFQKLQDRVAHGLKQVGPNITTAAICQTLAFIVGSLTKMPALQDFCIQAAFAIIFNYIFQLTTFVVVYVMDEQRKKNHQLDVFCCFKSVQQKKQPRNFWKNIFAGPYYNLLIKSWCFIVIMIISVLLLGLAVYGSINVPVGLNEQVSMQVDSDLFNYFTYQKKYIQIGPPSYIVLNGFDYRNNVHLKYIQNLNSQVAKLKYIQPPVYTWFASFNNFLMKGQSWSDICGSNDLQQYSYEQKLKKFLDISITSSCCQSFGICGQQYSTDMQFGQDGRLISSRLRVMHKPLRNSYDYIRAARQMRMVVAYVMDPLTKSNPQLQAYAYSLFYVYYDQYSYIRSVAIQNLLLALAIVILAVTIIKNLQIAITIAIVVLVTTLDLIGFVYITNQLFPDHGFVVQVNAISVVNLITCVGLSVQFSAHVCINMLDSKNRLNAKQKLQQCLRNTGSSVFIGIGLTKFTGVLVLALAKSTLFRLYYFRMYLGIVLLGLFNGLMVLPVILYKISPNFYTKGSTLLSIQSEQQEQNCESKQSKHIS